MFAPVTDGPADLRRVCFRPPAIQLRKIQSAIDQHLHAAGAARFPGASRRVHPEIDALNQLLRHEQRRSHSGRRREIALPGGATNSIHCRIMSWPGQSWGWAFPASTSWTGRSRFVRMLHEPLRIMQEKVRTLVSRKTARKAQSQCVGVEYLGSLRKFLGRSTSASQLPDVQFANVMNERLAPIGAKLPEIGVADTCENRLPDLPSLRASDLFRT